MKNVCFWEMLLSARSRRKEFGLETIDCVFISYALHNNTSRFVVIDSKNNLVDDENTICKTRDVKFFKYKFPFKEKFE